MLRILPAILTLLLTAGGWFAVPDSGIETERDSSYIAWIAKDRSIEFRICSASFDRFDGIRIGNAGSQDNDNDNVRPSYPQMPALPPFAGLPVQVDLGRVAEFRSRPVDLLQAFRLRQRPPPPNA